MFSEKTMSLGATLSQQCLARPEKSETNAPVEVTQEEGWNEETLTAVPWAERGVAPACTLAMLSFVSGCFDSTHLNMRAHTHTQQGLQFFLALTVQQEGGGSNGRGMQTEKEGLGRGSRQVRCADVKGWRGRRLRRMLREGLCQPILVHQRSSPPLIRNFHSQERGGQNSEWIRLVPRTTYWLWLTRVNTVSVSLLGVILTIWLWS